MSLNFKDLFSDSLNSLDSLDEPMFVSSFDKQKIYICLCEYSVKSRIAAEILNQEGFCGYFLA